VETLVALAVSQNMLTGNFPESFASLTNLAFLLASRTYLGGMLSPTLLQKMKSLVKIDISHSSFEGTLPPFGQELSSLRIVQARPCRRTASLRFTQGLRAPVSPPISAASRQCCCWP
jgi:hypothetical protein